MSLILWSSDWETGIDKIDAQHKFLFKQMSDLFDALQNKDGYLQITDMLGYLATYVNSHFHDEEMIMEAANYPGLVLHRAIHDALNKQVGELLTQAQADSLVITQPVVHFLVSWLLDHLMGEDHVMALYLKDENLQYKNQIISAECKPNIPFT